VAAEYLAMELEVGEPRFQNSTFHKLQGPYSPLEMRMFGKVQSLLGSKLKIEDDSVNSVILEDQPGDKHERVLVAANVRTMNLKKIDYFNYTFVCLCWFFFLSYRLDLNHRAIVSLLAALLYFQTSPVCLPF
jgi:hypothetical protein